MALVGQLCKGTRDASYYGKAQVSCVLALLKDALKYTKEIL